MVAILGPFCTPAECLKTAHRGREGNDLARDLCVIHHMSNPSFVLAGGNEDDTGICTYVKTVEDEHLSNACFLSGFDGSVSALSTHNNDKTEDG